MAQLRLDLSKIRDLRHEWTLTREREPGGGGLAVDRAATLRH